MSDRKLELERKKAKLEAIRAEKRKKEEEKRKQLGKTPTETTYGIGDIEANKLLEGLGISGSSIEPNVSPQRSDVTSNTSSPIPIAQQTGAPINLKPVSLSVSKVTQTSIPPREVVVYSKEVQTTNSEPPEALTYVDLDDADTDSLVVGIDTPPASKNDHHPQHPPQQTEKELNAAPPVPRELSEEEQRQIMLSDEFINFFDRTSRIVERQLNESSVDIFTDYTGGDGGKLMQSDIGERIKFQRSFADERWTMGRTVTCLDWSSQYPELLAASYNQKEDAPHEPDGVVLIWNAKYKKNTPEYIFHCQSAVTSVCFATFHPNLVVGGTYSGKIVLWDNRSSRRTPVQKTQLSASTHTHPVYCVTVVGTPNANNLISISTDGKMCSWSLEMLSQPQESLELTHKQSKCVAATSMSFLSNDVNNLVLGSEDGSVYTACRHGSKAGITDSLSDSHGGPVTGIHSNHVTGPVDMSHYFLTSSFDWTIKLWSVKEQKCLHSFDDNNDYVMDVSWSPIHPALFAAVDASGRLDLWNINSDVEVPFATETIDSALNECRWHHNGQMIAVGDDIGRVHLLDVSENIATPKNDDWTRMVHALQDMKQEEDENAILNVIR